LLIKSDLFNASLFKALFSERESLLIPKTSNFFC
jgi:hypothetical protein